MNGNCQRINSYLNPDITTLASMPPYANPGKWLNISWLLEGVDLKSILLSIGLSTYLLLAVGIVAGELEVMARDCVHCRMEMAGVRAPEAPKSVRKLMRYHGVNVLKTHNDENFILHKGRWEKVRTERPT